MAYCPSCGYEFVEGITECPDCGVPLENHLEEHEDQPAKWVILRRVSAIGEGKIIRGLMLANGIPSVVEDISFGMIPESYGDLSVIKVLVREQDLDKAETILKNNSETTEEEASED